MARRTLWPLALPLTGASTLLAHQGAYGLAGRAHDHLHGYLGHLPLLFAAFASGVLLAVVLRLRGRLGGRPAAWPYGVLPVVVYLVQETIERIAAGAAPTADGRALLLGLALQLPLGLAAYLLARTLLSGADAALELIAERIALVPTAAPALAVAPTDAVCFRIALRSRGRSPPAP